MLWHLIDNRGNIIRSTTAGDKHYAQRVLGPGTIVSDVSWHMDRHLWQPVEVYQTPKLTKASRPRYGPLPREYRTTKQVSQQTGISQRRIRYIVEYFELQIRRFDRGRFGFTEPQIRRIVRLDHRLNSVLESALIDKRRQGYLAMLRRRYAAGIHGRKRLTLQ